MHPALISIDELKAQLHKGIVVIDCRFNLMDKAQGSELYRQGHIPGAYFLDLEKDLSAPVQTHGGRHPLPDIAQLEQKLRSIGVNQNTQIIAYDDSRMAYAAHAWWLLRYLGHKNVSVLNGGFSAWKNQGGTIDRREPALKLGNFKAAPQSDWTRNRNDILDNPQFVLIDSREAKRFQGLEEPIDPIAGHIPSAINYPWQANTNEQGFMQPEAYLKEYWQTLPSHENLVAYCGSGVTACVNILSLHIIGIDAKLYPGSWSDWCSYMNTSE